jgi:FkbM family methyltransferase
VFSAEQRMRWLRALAARDRLTRLAERAGARALADQLDRIRHDGDVVAVTLPLREVDVRSKRIKMFRCGGRDQVADAFHEHGWRGFEHPVPSLFRAAVDRSHGAVYDVGANTGVYALVAAATGREVHAFEPNPAVAELLRANVKLNDHAARVQVVEMAVSDREGTATLFLPPPTGESVETSASLDARFKERTDHVIEVPVTSLDAHWRAAGRPEVGVVKIDVEGHEGAVLDGALELIAACRPVVFLEVLGNVDALEEARARLGYVDVRLSHVEAIFGDAVRFDTWAWNHALLPPDWVTAFMELARTTQLVVTDLGWAGSI